jgi:hypothetical protein
MACEPYSLRSPDHMSLQTLNEHLVKKRNEIARAGSDGSGPQAAGEYTGQWEGGSVVPTDRFRTSAVMPSHKCNSSKATQMPRTGNKPSPRKQGGVAQFASAHLRGYRRVLETIWSFSCAPKRGLKVPAMLGISRVRQSLKRGHCRPAASSFPREFKQKIHMDQREIGCLAGMLWKMR